MEWVLIIWLNGTTLNVTDGFENQRDCQAVAQQVDVMTANAEFFSACFERTRLPAMLTPVVVPKLGEKMPSP